jgi:SSS family solute:Na+ symporter
VLYEYLQNVQSLLAPAIFAVFLLGITSKRVNAKGALYGMIIGFGLGMLRLLLDILEGSGLLTSSSFLYPIVAVNWLHFCILLFFICVAIIYFVSLATEPPSEEKLRGLTFKTVSDEDAELTRASWNAWDVIHTVIVAGIVLAVFIYFN